MAQEWPWTPASDINASFYKTSFCGHAHALHEHFISQTRDFTE